MPIRFRCAYCDQLMGISRRKAGSVVRCPNCQGQVVVPTPEEGAHVEKSIASPKDNPLFERSDFDEVFDTAATGRNPPPTTSSRPPASAPPAAAPKPAEPTLQKPPADFPAIPQIPTPPPGIVLSPALATLISVVIVIALALAFAIGLLIGLNLRGNPDEQSSHVPDRRKVHHVEFFAAEGGRSLLAPGTADARPLPDC